MEDSALEVARAMIQAGLQSAAGQDDTALDMEEEAALEELTPETKTLH